MGLRPSDAKRFITFGRIAKAREDFLRKEIFQHCVRDFEKAGQSDVSTVFFDFGKGS